jgi:hypothetical protein
MAMLKNSNWKFKIVVFVGTILRNIRWFWLMVLHLTLVEEMKKHYEKRGNFATSLATQFLNCMTTLQFIVFLCCECYWRSCMSC